MRQKSRTAKSAIACLAHRARANRRPEPVIRDPVLARAVDLIKGLAIVREIPPLISALTIRPSQPTLIRRVE